ncbi:hypothetical protein GCM10022285_57070 [Streptomyces tunisiensis]|uniref:Uncharacterized protein n=1 Tax=Streptomyces tunisiensis TaxID=948699 RepID=A0ABP7Z747_9ACTN
MSRHGGRTHSRPPNYGAPPHVRLTCGFLRCGDTQTSPQRQEVVPMSSPSTAPPAPNNLKRIVAASLIGTTIEWYDNSFDQG